MSAQGGEPGATLRGLVVLELFVALLSGLAMATAARAQLPPTVVQALAEAGIPDNAVAFVVAPVAGDSARFVDIGTARPLQPGSTMKLVTTLVGLEQLGPAWRGRTRLLASAPPKDGVLTGQLVLQGAGNLDFDMAALQTLLRRARDRGLKELRGDLVVDRSAYRPARPDLGIPPFDESPEFEYNLVPDAMLVGHNLVRLELFADERGLQVVPLTPLAGLRITHEMTLVQGDCRTWDEGWRTPELRDAIRHPEVRPGRGLRQPELVLRGTWPAGCDRALAINVLDRNEYIERHFRALWTALGGRWRGKLREGVAPADAVLLGEHLSRPLSELVRAINKPSDNALTRVLLLEIGRAADGAADEPTLARADRAVRRWLRERGIDDTGFVVDNGSGLSRSERLTAAQLVGVVRAGLASRWAPEFIASLPVAGIDGTLRTRLQGSPAAGWARMKTGTLRNTVALAGTMPDGAGVPRIVVAMINHDNVRPRETRRILDQFIDWVARTPFGAPSAAASATAAADVSSR